MINVYICEDEEIQLKIFKKQMERYLAESGKNAKIILAEQNPERILERAINNPDTLSLFFIDIELKGYLMDGFALVQKLIEVSSQFGFVFLTSHSEMAYKVFDYRLQIIDYIVKRPEFFAKNYFDEEIISRIDGAFYTLEKRTESLKEQVEFEVGSRKMYVPQQDIICIQTEKGHAHYYQVICANATFRIRSTMTQLTERFSEGFVVISSSGMIAVSHIREIRKDERVIIMDNGVRCLVPRKNMKKVCREIEDTRSLTS